MEKKLDSNSTRILRAILNESWRQHPQNSSYSATYHPSQNCQRRTRHAGHCVSSMDELISDVLQWTPAHGRANFGRPAKTYIQELCAHTVYSPNDLSGAMNDRDRWRERVREIRAGSATWGWWYTRFFNYSDFRYNGNNGELQIRIFRSVLNRNQAKSTAEYREINRNHENIHVFLMIKHCKKKKKMQKTFLKKEVVSTL